VLATEAVERVNLLLSRNLNVFVRRSRTIRLQRAAPLSPFGAALTDSVGHFLLADFLVPSHRSCLCQQLFTRHNLPMCRCLTLFEDGLYPWKVFLKRALWSHSKESGQRVSHGRVGG